MAWKWSAPVRLAQLLKQYSDSGDPRDKRALEHFQKKMNENTLPAQLDPEHKAACFENGIMYSESRIDG